MVKVALFACEVMARSFQELTDDVELFRVGEAVWVFFRRPVDMLASADPHGIGVFP